MFPFLTLFRSRDSCNGSMSKMTTFQISALFNERFYQVFCWRTLYKYVCDWVCSVHICASVVCTYDGQQVSKWPAYTHTHTHTHTQTHTHTHTHTHKHTSVCVYTFTRRHTYLSSHTLRPLTAQCHWHTRARHNTSFFFEQSQWNISKRK